MSVLLNFNQCCSFNNGYEADPDILRWPLKIKNFGKYRNFYSSKNLTGISYKNSVIKILLNEI